MALVIADRVQQQGTANTTVSFTLTTSVLGFQSFAVIGNGNTTFYAATDASGNWEVGLGTYSTTGPTLTRTTILASSNAGSAVTFSGIVNVFCTYPSEKSVNLDASGNVTALGTITSGVWNGTTIPVAYGGTGVTTSSGANSVVLRDANQNITANNIFVGFTTTATSGGTTVLTAASTGYQRFTGTLTHTVQLPNATTLPTGYIFTIDNDSTQSITIKDNASSTLDTIIGGSVDTVVLLNNGTSAGTWVAYGLLPATYDFGDAGANFGGATLTNGIWNGTPIAYNYGGTTLTTFGGANNALYSTSATALAAGTLPVAAGGTGLTAVGTSGNVLTSNGTGWVSSALAAAGATTQVQYNNAGAFGASSSFTFDGTALTAPVQIASNGIVVNSATVSASYSIPSGSNASSAGPITVNTGVTVTIPTGSNWVIVQ